MTMVDTAVVALAGRRIDLPEAPVPRFPLENVQEVGRRVCEALYEMHAVALVCSAACGADLVALEQAKHLGLRRRVVLPFAPERFRETSVVDRPGNWGSLYDRYWSGKERHVREATRPPDFEIWPGALDSRSNPSRRCR